MKRLLLLAFIAPLFATAQAPAGYYNGAYGQTCATLKTTLKNIITNGHNPQSYGDLMTVYPTSDVKPREVGSGSANVIWDIYSDIPGPANDPYNYTPVTHQCGNYDEEGDCYNREHSFPASWFNDEAPAYTDFFHVLPTDGWVNNARGNLRFGEVASANYTSMNGSKRGTSATAGISGTVFEPINEYKGDMARAYLYMVTRYQDRLSTWNGYNTDGALTLDGTAFPAVDINYLKLMLKWHNQDPVSDKERNRNNAGYNFQGNRNPFVDSPQYVNLIWNASCPGLGALPVDLISFGGKLNGNMVELNWEVAREVGFDRYEIERSFNGVDYSKIGEVKAANLSEYSYKDDVEKTRGRRIYYRLKKVDKDGRYNYSAVFSLHIPLNTKFTVYPNPATDYIKVQLNNNIHSNVTIEVTDAAGRVVVRNGYVASNGLVTLSTQHLQSGSYLLKMIVVGEQFVHKIQVIK